MATRGKDKEPGRVEDPMVAMARGLAEIVAEHGLSELILDSKGVTLTVRRGVTASVASTHMMSAPIQQHSFAPPAPSLPAAPAAVAAPAPVDDKAHVVTSPFVGTFYRKPNPDSANYVSQGEKISKGQVLCIVEAMKLMNEIEAEVAGTVTAILVEDGQSVEYGQPLFKIA
jgi:acetyl-CoA carboxylase biotin carboxyl carrier protein